MFLYRILKSVLFLLVCLLAMPNRSEALHVTIIESQSYLSSDLMDIKWQSVLTGMGHTSTILPQSTLDNTSFFSNTDILLISNGSITLPPNRVNTILQFLQIGKPVYLQGEYNCSLSSNQAFAYLVNTLGGTFNWGGVTNGILQLNILTSFATTSIQLFNPVLNNFNFGCHGAGCGIQYFLEGSGKFYGYFFCPPNPSIGRLIQITDQDWINSNANDTLMKNVMTHLIDPSLCSATNFTPTNLGHDTTLCNGTSMVLNATNSNATYVWQNGSANPTFTVTTAGTYWVQVTNNCGVFSDTIVVNYAAAPNLNLGNDTSLCAGQQLVLNATTAGASYLWQDGSTGATYTVTASGTYSVVVNVGGCVSSDLIHVNFLAVPGADIGNDTTLCEGQTLLLDAFVSGASYLWQDGSVLPTYTVTQAGTYSVNVTTTCGVASDHINVVYMPIPQVDLGNDTVLCAGASITLNASTANAVYLWSNGSNQATMNVNNQGIYWAEVTVNQCSNRDTIVVDMVETPDVQFGADVKLCKGESLTLNPDINNATYVWQDLSTGPTFTVTSKGIYWVIANVNNCTGSDTIFVDYYPESCNCNMFVPNAFSPNRDGLNDEFKYIVSEGNIELIDFIIYNRWGGIAFKAQSIFDSWDGKIKGSEAENGTYYYQIHYKCNFTNQSYFLKGDVILIR